jgi:hypothetical protein
MNAFDWLHNLYMSPEYEEVAKIYALCTPEIWERYVLFQIEGLREQELLEEAGKLLTRKWRTNRPRLLGRKRNEQNTNC